MDTTTFDITNGKAINVTPMTPEEARECTEAIKRDLESLRLKLLSMERRRGWEALGYSSWREWAAAEIGKSERRVYEILEAAKVEENLTFCGIPQNEIPTTISQLNELAKLPQEQQPEALQKAQEIAQAEGKKRNAAHVAQAVQELKPSKKQKETKTQSAFANLTSSTSQPKTGWDISPQSLTTTVSSRRIMVHFEDRGDEYFFEFCGPEDSISESGFYSELISDRAIVRREYLNPGVWADFRAEKLYADYQKSLAESTWTNEHITAAVDADDADAATSKECIVVSASATPTPSPWAVVAEFSITVGDGSVVQVKFFPEGLVHRLDFRGAVSETGYYCEFIPAQIAQRYRSPKECAQALADDLHTQWMNVQAKKQLYKHGIAAGDTVRILLGKGKHSDKITEATSVSAKEIVTPLGTFKPSALVKYIDRTAEMKRLGIVPEADVQVDHLKAKVTCTFADGRVLVLGRYYHYSEVTVLEEAAAAQPTQKPKSAKAEDKGAIATSVEVMLPEILSLEYEPGKEKQAPADLSEVGSAADMDAMIDFYGTTAVSRMFVAASPELQQIVRGYYPGIGALVTSELGGSEFNKIADRAGFLPSYEPDAVRVDMLIQENARLDETLRLCEEHVQRLERENSKLHSQLDELLQALKEAQAEIERLW